MNHDIIDTFSTQLRAVFARSIDTAWELQQESIPPILLLWSIAMQDGSAGADILKTYAITQESIRAQFPLQSSTTLTATETNTAKGKRMISFLWPEFSTHTKRVIERGAVIAFELQHTYIGTEHILLALIERADETITHLLAEYNLNTTELTQKIIVTMRSAQAIHDIQHATHMNDATHQTSSHPTQQSTNVKNESAESDTPALDFFGIDLTSEEQQRRLTPVIGRDTEINRLIHILSRKTKNNPVLIGDPGVGKTAIVEGLAQKIVQGAVPDALIGKRIVSLDLTSMLSGTMYRGDYESRIKAIIEELKTHNDIIVFVDELHTIIGAGNAMPGSLDTAHMLKPPLARGELRCIGATTTEEYRKHIEADSALERRFQPVVVNEPSEENTMRIISGIEKYYADFHRVVYTEEAIRASVHYAARYLPDRHFPDKAIDLLDEAGAMKRSTQPSSSLEREIQLTTKHLRETRKKKIQAVKNEHFQEAIDLKVTEDTYVKRLESLRAQHKTTTSKNIAVTARDIADVVSVMCHIPVEYMDTQDTQPIHELKQKIQRRVFGQPDAVKHILAIVERSLAGLQPEHRPLASVLCFGPSGVGKSTFAHALAEELFHTKDALLHLNMSEFSEGFAVTKMLGAPAGYVGHKESIKFIDHIRRHPYSVILFDEIEKAHPDVLNVIIQMIDRGRITDSTGRTVLCNHTIFMLTSHIAEDTFAQQAALGFVTEKNTPKKTQSEPIKLNTYFSSDLLNALDAHVTFAPLSQKAVEHIVSHHIDTLNSRLQSSTLSIRLSKTAITHLAKKGFTPESGARGVAQKIIETIEQPLAENILNKIYVPHDCVHIDYKDNQLQWKTVSRAPRIIKKTHLHKKKAMV